MRNIDFTSLQSVLATLMGLVLVTLIGVGIRLVMMMTIQQRRERMNRQINERLRVLIAAYKTLGGSFTGDLAVDPRHLRDVRAASVEEVEPGAHDAAPPERGRRIRDAVEAALSDIILLGNEEHVRLAVDAAQALAAGRPVHTQALVASLRNFIRHALDLAPIPSGLAIPMQGPSRTIGTGGRKPEGKDGGGKGGGGQGMGMGGAIGMAGLGGAMSVPAHTTPDGDTESGQS